MKKALVYSFFLLFAASTMLHGQDSAEQKKSLTKIDCPIVPLALTPKGQRMTNPQSGAGFSSLLLRPTKSIPHDADGPIIRTKQRPGTYSASLNWSGYAALTSLENPKKHSVKNVKGSWTIPTIVTSIVDAYSATWVGIDGYSNQTVEQIGTESDSIGGAQSNYAWFEMYPTEAFLISGFPVNAGDVMRGMVSYVGDGVFRLILINFTRGVYTEIPKEFTVNKDAERSSAEWIVEGPFTSEGALPLANFGTITFLDCVTKIRGTTGGIQNRHWKRDRITMVNASGIGIKAKPSRITDEKNFSITWQSSGVTPA